MEILRRSKTVILDTNIRGLNPVYNPVKPVLKDALVDFGKNTYKALKDIPANDKAPDPIDKDLKDSEKFTLMGADNVYACFDVFLNTRSVSDEDKSLRYRLSSSDFFTGIYLGELDSKEVRIKIYDARTNALLESEKYSLYTNKLMSWSEYFFNTFAKNPTLSNIFYRRTTMTRSVVVEIEASGYKHNSIGQLFIGNANVIPLTLYSGNTIGMLDFSKVKTNEKSGATMLEVGNMKKQNSFKLLVELAYLNKAYELLANIRATPCVFVIASDSRYQPLVVFGFLKNYEILLEKIGASVIDIQVEGLI